MEHLAVRAFDVEVVNQPVLQNDPQGLEGVPPADLLPLFVRAAVVGDGHLVDPESTLGGLGRDLRFKPEPLASQGKGLDDSGAEDLVARLHVSNVQVGAEVGHKRQEAVGQRMAEVQNAPGPAGKESRSVHHVRPALQDGGQEARIVARVILQVRVLDENDVTAGLLDATLNRRAFALVDRLADESDFGMLGGELDQALRSPVC